jgi:hypothetical protein
LEKRVKELKGLYPNVQSKTLQDGTILIRVNGIHLPEGCTPNRTDFLMTFPPNQDVPNGRFVKEQVRLPSGVTPNFSPIMQDGETWYGYSYNFLWTPAEPIFLYVETAIQRFGKAN